MVGKAVAALCVMGALMLASPFGIAAQSDDPAPTGLPINVRVVGEGDGSVTVAWDAPKAEAGWALPTGYRVLYRLMAPEPGSQPMVTRRWKYGEDVAASRRQATVPHLNNGVWYEMWVASIGSEGWSYLSEEVVPARPGVEPVGERLLRAPRDVRVVGEGAGSVTVAWDAPADDGGSPVTGYEVWYVRYQDRWADGADEVTWVRSDEILGGDALRIVIEGLADYQEYHVVVAAVNRVGRGSFSDEVSAVAGRNALAPPGAPVNVRLAEVADGSVTVAWDAPESREGQAAPSGYVVLYRTAATEPRPPAAGWRRAAYVGADVLEWAVVGLTNGVSYDIRVASIGGDWSGEIRTARPGHRPLGEGLPGVPVNVRLAEVGDGLVTVAWDAPADDGGSPVTGYEVWYVRHQDWLGEDADEVVWVRSGGVLGGDARRHVIEGLADYQAYVVVVAAVNRVGRGSFSDEVFPVAGSDAPTPPGAPASVRVEAEDLGLVTVAWDAPADDGGSPVTGYEVWYVRHQDWLGEDADEVVWVRSGGVLGGDARRHVIEGLADYQAYVVVVAAVNRVGRGSFSGKVFPVAGGDDLDPLGLIVAHSFTKTHSLGTDTWEVWVCDVADGDMDIDLRAAVALLNRELPPYFSWLSGDRYHPTFVEGGLVKAELEGGSPRAHDYGCDEMVAEASEGRSDGALIVLDKRSVAGVGGAGWYDGSTYPENGRDVQIRAAAVLPVSAYCGNCKYPDHVYLDNAAHEIGHALGWPHSFGGNRAENRNALREIGMEADEYDNPMDLLSGGPANRWISASGLVAGTIAVNRYAAGWIDPDDIAMHHEPYGSYLLAPIGGSGIQMLVVPTGQPGHFISLGARVARGYDRGIPASGVEIYRVDQRAFACFGDDVQPNDRDRFWCIGTNRRTRQIPAPKPGNDRPIKELVDHVYGPGDGLTVEGYRVEVTERIGDRFRVWVGNPHRGTFADDENNAHERNIEKLAAQGITGGCDPDLKLYCPDRVVTRAQMAKFLMLALGEAGARRPGPSGFADVKSDAWYRPFVDRLAELGITTGYADGTFRPDEPVTRAQLAVFLTRAFDGISEVTAATGVFADVSASASYAGAVEGVLAADVTRGCTRAPGRNYCPHEPVRRDQIASFLTRAMQTSP